MGWWNKKYHKIKTARRSSSAGWIVQIYIFFVHGCVRHTDILVETLAAPLPVVLSLLIVYHCVDTCVYCLPLVSYALSITTCRQNHFGVATINIIRHNQRNCKQQTVVTGGKMSAMQAQKKREKTTISRTRVGVFGECVESCPKDQPRRGSFRETLHNIEVCKYSVCMFYDGK